MADAGWACSRGESTASTASGQARTFCHVGVRGTSGRPSRDPPSAQGPGVDSSSGGREVSRLIRSPRTASHRSRSARLAFCAKQSCSYTGRSSLDRVEVQLFRELRRALSCVLRGSPGPPWRSGLASCSTQGADARCVSCADSLQVRGAVAPSRALSLSPVGTVLPLTLHPGWLLGGQSGDAEVPSGGFTVGLHPRGPVTGPAV